MPIGENNNDRRRNSVPGMSGDSGLEGHGDVVDPGAVLRSARLAAGISIEQMAQRLHLVGRVVEAIEANDLRQFSAIAYLRGYVRNYAKLLGIDPAPLLRAYAEEKTGVILPPPSLHKRTTSEDGEENGERHGASRAIPVLLTGLFVGLVLLLTWQWPAVEDVVREYRENLARDGAGGPTSTWTTEEPTVPARLPDNAANEQTPGGPDSRAAPVSDPAALDNGDSASRWPATEMPGVDETNVEPTDSRGLAAGEGRFDAASTGRLQAPPEARENAPVARGRLQGALSTESAQFPGEAAASNRPGMDFAEERSDDLGSPRTGGATETTAFDTEMPDDLAPTQRTPAQFDAQRNALEAADGLDAPTASRDFLRVRRITPTGDDELWFEFAEDCWVEIYNQEGRSLYQDLLRRRQSLRLVGSGPFQIQLGYAPGVTLEFNGKPVPLEPHTRNTVASLVIGQ